MEDLGIFVTSAWYLRECFSVLDISDTKQGHQAGWVHVRKGPSKQFNGSSKTYRIKHATSRYEVTENRYEQHGRKKTQQTINRFVGGLEKAEV